MVRATQLVFGDLSYSISELQKKRTSPVDVRREFGRYITLTQQLTEAMRKEYKSIGGENWEASKFDKWDKFTQLFKVLRKTDYHEAPVTINVKERRYYVAELLEDDLGNEYKNYAVIEVTWGLGDPFCEEVPNNFELLAYDENMQPVEDIQPEKVEYEFLLVPRSNEVKKLLDAIGEDDVHVLSEKCFYTLRQYYDYYNACVNQAR